MPDEPYILIGADPANSATHVIIEVRGVRYSTVIGTEQSTANEIRDNLGAG